MPNPKMNQEEKDKLKTAVENNYMSVESFLTEKQKVLTKKQTQRFVGIAKRIEETFDRKVLSIRTIGRRYIKVFPKETLEKAINLI